MEGEFASNISGKNSLLPPLLSLQDRTVTLSLFRKGVVSSSVYCSFVEEEVEGSLIEVVSSSQKPSRYEAEAAHVNCMGN